MGFDIEAIRKEFPILERTIHGKRLVYLDNAASAQKPRMMLEALTHFYTHSYANIHRGLYTLAEEATEAYEGARARVARFIHAADPAEVIFVRNATEGINLVAYTWGRAHVKAGDRIVVTQMEHHSNLVPWQQLARERGAELAIIPVNDEGELILEALDPWLADGRTRLIAVTAMSNMLGTIPPVALITARAHAAGALVLVDAAQAAPHLPVDVQALGADFLAISAHKLGGPGIGALWARKELLEAMSPFLFGGDMIRRVEWQDAQWNDLPWKFEAGTPEIGEAVGFGAAIEFMESLGMEAVHQHEVELVTYALGRMAEVPGLRTLGPGPERRGGVISFTLEGIHPHDVAAILDSDGICIRAGHHCAQPLHMRFGLGASARASFFVYNGPDDVDALIAGLHKVNQVMRRGRG